MSRSAFDPQVVLEAVVRAGCDCAARTTASPTSSTEGPSASRPRPAAARSSTPGSATHPIRPGRESVVGRVALIGEAIRVDDVLADREYIASPGQQVGGYRSLVGVPMEQDGTIAASLP